MAIATLLGLTACGGAGFVTTQVTISPPTPAPSTTTSRNSTTTDTTLGTAGLDPGWTLAARADLPLDVFRFPEAPTAFATLSERTELGSLRVVEVLEGPVEGWLRVSVPVRPNGTEGWVRSEDVVLFPVDRRVEVDLSDRTLIVYRDGEEELRTTIAIGRPSNPTPTGHYFITDSVILSDPTGPWGPHAFGLSAFSDTITEFNGNDAVIGIHGTNSPSSIGAAQSLGCVRVPNEVVAHLAMILSAGVTVTIAD